MKFIFSKRFGLQILIFMLLICSFSHVASAVNAIEDGSAAKINSMGSVDVTIYYNGHAYSGHDSMLSVNNLGRLPFRAFFSYLDVYKTILWIVSNQTSYAEVCENKVTNSGGGADSQTRVSTDNENNLPDFVSSTRGGSGGGDVYNRKLQNSPGTGAIK
jgi:hypothetical protein